jgi:putative transposase
MPNHFHILLKPLIKNGVSLFMHKLCIAYATYFNQKYTRTGTLFEGRFKAKNIDNDRYLKYVFSYIHLNVQKLIPNLNDYPYSSFLDYCGQVRIQNKIINKKLFPEYFSTKEDFLNEINQWILYRESLDPV